ncbi:hypothetical protein AK812_SmicGene13516 [Symbiodinium microadriaticum]|uniref:Uncharacterized protein n=1 Tax=Symbiodinium microadriaticum TaxID=2951 RepID=A0A1Q9E7Z8_SYMMI|nr:hypothetical protein AK812_SmicGene13516 [Symbiodinium microadriaticum]
MLRASLLFRKRNQKSRGSFRYAAHKVQVGEQDLLLNFDLLKSYLVHVVTSKGVPVLSDHKVAFMHISSTYSLHPDVRTKRGGKAEVKEWAHVEAWKLRSLLSALQRLANKKIKVLKKLFAVQMRWISADELDDHDDAEPEDSSDALVPADEVDDNVAEHEDDVLGAINDLGHDAEPDASNDLGHDAEPGASNDSGHDAPSGAGSDSGAESSADKSIPKVPKDL